MANELDFTGDMPMTLVFTIANVAGGPVISLVDGVIAGANATNGMIVPAGYAFHPLFIEVEVNDARTAGTAIFKVTSDGTELSNGPEATLDATNTTQDTGIQRPGTEPVAAGAEVGVSATGDTSWAPDTADADVILYGVLRPA